MLAGDIIHHPVQIAEPWWSAKFLDVDPDHARETRFRFLERYADTDVLVLDAHFAAPTAGYIVEFENSWQFDVRRRLR